MLIRLSVCALVVSLTSASSVDAQQSAAAPKALATTASAGLALTNGNRDTSTVNVGYELSYDPKTRNIVKSDGLYLRGKTEGDLTTDRLGLNGRDKYKLHDRAFIFGQLQYLAGWGVAGCVGHGANTTEGRGARHLQDAGDRRNREERHRAHCWYGVQALTGLSCTALHARSVRRDGRRRRRSGSQS